MCKINIDIKSSNGDVLRDLKCMEKIKIHGLQITCGVTN